MRTLGIDLGTNSIGWAVIETNGEPGEDITQGAILAAGVRIFSQTEFAGRNPKSMTSLAVARRVARGMRRRRDRYLRRREELLKTLTECNLLPENQEDRKSLLVATSDKAGGDLEGGVYALRAKAVSLPVTLHQLGRILFQINQRRGFKSNRKTDRGANEAGKIAIGSSRLEQEMMAAGAKTYGAYLHHRRLKGLSVRTRLRPETGDNAKGTGYDFYPTRAMLESEFDAIAHEQAKHYPELLTPETIARLRHIIFFQRDLKKPLIGKCSYNPNEERLPKAHPLYQQFRLFKEVNELKLINEKQEEFRLSPDQRNALILRLRDKKEVTFKSLRSVLKLGAEWRFNKESENRTKLTGDEVAAELSGNDKFGQNWHRFSDAEKADIVDKLLDTADPDKLAAWLTVQKGLDMEHALSVCDAWLPEGYSRIGESAARNLLDAMKHELDNAGRVITESEAAQRVFGKTNSERPINAPGHAFLLPYQEILTRSIPSGTGDPNDDYEKRWGRITNPTVHIGLNQLRRVVNAVIKRHGKPDRISIEIGREMKLSDTARDEVNKEIGRNTRAAELRSGKLHELGQTDSGYNRLLLKLWEELHEKPEARVCIYCGTPISLTMLFGGQADRDHILPYSLTLDDSNANQLICCASCNRQKSRRAPSDVPEWHERYGDVLARANALPKAKRWRFAENAMEKFMGERDFIARQLTDMQYLSRLALTYLSSLYPAEEAGSDGILRRHSRVRALPGKMTELLRRNWGLNRELLPDSDFAETTKVKNRKDHRHHAIDAVVIACISRALIQRLAQASGQLGVEGSERVAAKVPEPWPGFRLDLRAALASMLVSHKADHGTISRRGYAKGIGQTAGGLHNDTAYGFARDKSGKEVVVHRVALTSFSNAGDLALIRDDLLREALQKFTIGKEGKTFQAALALVPSLDMLNGQSNIYRGIRHVRVIENLQVIPIRDKDGSAYKGYKGDANYRFDIWQLKNGKWRDEVVSMFDAHRPGWVSPLRQENPTARKILSLQQNDIVALEDVKGKTLLRVVKFSHGKIVFAGLNESGSLKARDADEGDPFKYFVKSGAALKALRARQVRMDELGRVWDPGPRA